MKGAVKPQQLLPLLLLAVVQPACAFYTWQAQDRTVEVRGFLRGAAVALSNPDNDQFYVRKNFSAAALFGRLMLDASQDPYSVEIHAEQSYVPLDSQTGGARFASLIGVERSDLLDWSFDNKQSHLILDRLNIQFASEHLTLKVGRQPVNLAATNYFAPNDFFAPFSAQTFFRAYKPGVDALRADIQQTGLSQLTLLAVLGYSSNTGSDNGWSNTPDNARNAYLLRTSTVAGDFEYALLGGSLRKDRVLGGDLQGELFEWLGVSCEGHVRWPDSAGFNSTKELALGLDHRFENSLTIRFEQFYHGSGASSVAAYNSGAPNSSGYLARRYSAVGASYEFTPLLTGDATTIHNWIDQSSLIALYARYSLSDESELALSATLAMGDKPQGAVVQSEFGQYANSISMEYRTNF